MFEGLSRPLRCDYSPDLMFDWQIRYLDIYVFYACVVYSPYLTDLLLFRLKALSHSVRAYIRRRLTTSSHLCCYVHVLRVLRVAVA